MISTSLLIFSIACIIVWGRYAQLISRIRRQWELLPKSITPISEPNLPFASIIIAARNEESNIEKCLKALASQDYPVDKFEIIIVDDFSTDGTYTLLQKSTMKHLRIVQMSSEVSSADMSSKKVAIETAIKMAKGSLIVCTDADCEMKSKWLYSHVAYSIRDQTHFMTGPVILTGKSLFDEFQRLDYLGMMAVTAYGIETKKYFMANGANQSYLKESFSMVNGYEGNKGFSSGDDVFLIDKISSLNNSVVKFVFSPHMIVSTPAQAGIGSFYNQRLRWSTKNKHTASHSMNMIMVLIFLIHLLILMSMLLGIFLKGNYLFIGLLLFLSKMIVDYAMLKEVGKDFDYKVSLTNVFIASIINVPYILGIGISSYFIQNFKWKGRKVR